MLFSKTVFGPVVECRSSLHVLCGCAVCSKLRVIKMLFSQSLPTPSKIAIALCTSCASSFWKSCVSFCCVFLGTAFQNVVFPLFFPSRRRVRKLWEVLCFLLLCVPKHGFRKMLFSNLFPVPATSAQAFGSLVAKALQTHPTPADHEEDFKTS